MQEFTLTWKYIINFDIQARAMINLYSGLTAKAAGKSKNIIISTFYEW